MSLNRVMIIGNLGRDPESRTTASGMATCNFSVAVNSRKKGQNGEWEDQTEWFRVVAFDRLAERASQYLTKGRQVYVEGRLQTRSWNDKETNEKKTTTELIASNFELLGGRPGAGDGASSGGGFEDEAPAPTKSTKKAAAAVADDDEIPF